MSSLPPIVFVRQQTRKDQLTSKTAAIEAITRGILARHFRRDLSLKLIRAFQRACQNLCRRIAKSSLLISALEDAATVRER